MSKDRIRIGDVVKIIPAFYWQHAPMDIGVVEELGILGQGHVQFKVGFPMYEKKLWMTDLDVEVIGHCDG